jgi:hypothetical protein
VSRQQALKVLPIIRFLFAYSNTTSFAAQDRLALANAAGKKLSGGEDNYDGLYQFLFAAL